MTTINRTTLCEMANKAIATREAKRVERLTHYVETRAIPEIVDKATEGAFSHRLSCFTDCSAGDLEIIKNILEKNYELTVKNVADSLSLVVYWGEENN